MKLEIANLPALLMAAIRAGTWSTPNATTLRQVARVVSRAQAVGLPEWDMIDVLASVARADMPVPNTDWTPEMHAINDVIWPYLASSKSLDCTVHREYGPYSTPTQGLGIVERISADETAKATCAPEDADRIIRCEMERVRDLHPELGMSYGYIGNIYWGPRRDDRSFKVFTQLIDERGHSVSYGGCGYDRLGQFAFTVQRRLEDWARTQSERLARGEIRRQCAERRAA